MVSEHNEHTVLSLSLSFFFKQCFVAFSTAQPFRYTGEILTMEHVMPYSLASAVTTEVAN